MTAPTFLLMPQWQGSASSRAMQLQEGASLLAEDLPQSRRDIQIPLEAGDALGTPVARLSSLLQSRSAAEAELARCDGPGIIVGGDCSTALIGLRHALQRVPSERLAVLWLDAHADLQEPATSPTGAAAGMSLRHALGEGIADLALDPPITPELTVLAGVRSLTDEEAEDIERVGLRSAVPDTSPERGIDAALPSEIMDELAAAGATHLYVHVDVDVLDPAAFSCADRPEPFGLSPRQLSSAIRSALARFPLAGATLAGFAPASSEAAHEDLPTVLRVLAALTSSGSS